MTDDAIERARAAMRQAPNGPALERRTDAPLRHDAVVSRAPKRRKVATGRNVSLGGGEAGLPLAAADGGRTLTRHRDIQKWVTERRGLPTIVEAPNRFGELRARLELRFDRAAKKPVQQAEQGTSPVSWSAWLAELDRQQLALRVIEGEDTEYEFVERKTLN